MNITSEVKNNIETYGFAIIENVYTIAEIGAITKLISTVNVNKPAFRKTNDLFAIRQFLREIPHEYDLIFTEQFLTIINEIFGKDDFVVKSIYFDKPEQSNWFVAYHQDLTISVDKK